MNIKHLEVLAAIAAFLIISISGCAFFPIQTTSTYLEDLYKRIPYHKAGQYRVLNIFYATDRNIREQDAKSVYFGSELSEKMTCGSMDVKINPSLRIGAMSPERLKTRGIIGVQDVNKLEEDIFLGKIGEAVELSPHKSLLVLVFGYKDNFEATAIKAAWFAYLLDINTPILLFDWPGDQSVTPAGYMKARSYAEASGPHLGELLTKIIRQVKPKKLWVKGSSLGCQIMRDAFEHMHKYEDISDKDIEIDHVVLAAPDVGENEFDNRFKDEISSISKNVTAYVSCNDEALLVSGVITNERKLGRQCLVDYGQLDETKDLLYLKSLEPEKITLIDVTLINNSSYKHGYYLECPEFFDDMYMRLFDLAPNTNRRLYLIKYKDNVDYWVLQGTR